MDRRRGWVARRRGVGRRSFGGGGPAPEPVRSGWDPGPPGSRFQLIGYSAHGRLVPGGQWSVVPVAWVVPAVGCAGDPALPGLSWALVPHAAW